MKDTIRSALLGSAKVKTEPVALPDLGVTVEVRGVTAGGRGRLLNSARNEDGSLDFERYYAQLVIETAFDPEDGTQLFGAADLDAINALPSPIVQRLAEVAESLSGLGGDAQSALEKNSGATSNVATASASPNA